MIKVKLPVPKCNLDKNRFDFKGVSWKDFKENCLGLLVLLKSQQISNNNGLSWFPVDKKNLNYFLPDFERYLKQLLKVGILISNPYNQKLDFADNRSVDLGVEFHYNKHKKLRKLLMDSNAKFYGRYFRVKDQKLLRQIYQNRTLE